MQLRPLQEGVNPDHFEGYTLDLAFDLLGERLYGTDWRFNELHATRPKGKEPKQVDLDALEKQWIDCDAEVTRLRNHLKLGLETKAAELETLRKHEASALEAFQAADERLRAGRDEAGAHRIWGAWWRKAQTERRLIAAITSRQIKILPRLSGYEEALLLAPSDVSIALSQFTWTDREKREHRTLMRLAGKCFEAFLEEVEPINPGKAIELTPVLKARALMRQIGRGERIKKPTVIARLVEECGVKEGQAMEVWKELAPPKWKLAGAIPR